MSELEQIREEIGKIGYKVWKEEISINEGVKQILSIKGLRIEADNQELPRNPYGLKQGYDSAGSFAMVDSPERWGYECAQYDMLKDGWVKCKEEQDGNWQQALRQVEEEHNV